MFLSVVDVHVKSLRLYFKGKPLGGDSTLLSAHGIEHMSTIETHVDLKKVVLVVKSEVYSVIVKPWDKPRRESKQWLFADF